MGSRGSSRIRSGGWGVRFVLNYKDNGAVDEGGWRRRASSISALLFTKSIGMLRASSSNHKDAMNGGDDDKDTAW